MRRLSIIVVAGLLVGAEAPQGKKEADQLTQTLLKLEKDSWEMVKRRDAKAIREYATDNFLWIFWDGSRVQKDNLDKFLASYDLHTYSITEPVVIRFDAEAAVLVYHLTYTGAETGEKPVTVTTWSTSTYVRRGNEWKEILYQETPIKK